MEQSQPPDLPGPASPALRLKLRRPRPVEVAEPGAARAWRLALARAAAAAAALSLDVTALDDREAGLADVLELPGPQALILLLDGPAGQTGLAILSPPLVAGLVEAMTLGQVLRGAPEVRVPTRTDSVIAGAFLDAALREAEGLLASDPEVSWIADFHQATYLTDPRPLGYMLEDQPFRMLQADVALADGLRTGRLTLVLPARGRGRAPVAAPPLSAMAAPADDFGDQMARQVAGAEVRLDAVIAQLTLPLGRLMALQPGDMLALEGARLDLVTLTAIDGAVVGLGRLGQARGGRAVRLTRIGRQAEAGPADTAAA
jgi:flagellar motor switch protein FliM